MRNARGTEALLAQSVPLLAERARFVFHYEIKMAPFIDVVKKGENGGEKQHPDSG